MKINKMTIIVVLCYFFNVMHSQTLENDVHYITNGQTASQISKRCDVSKKSIKQIKEGVEPDLITLTALSICLNGRLVKDIDEKYRIVPRGEFLWVIKARYIDMLELTFCIPAETKLSAMMRSTNAALNLRPMNTIYTDVMGRLKKPEKRI